ncbi:NADPH-dependent FMN reductase [Rhodococcoides fascians]|uniref:NADPH-dependent FMN reductase n=1 Tax=Rhodococcoides fascians TaxID=1828 RepID=UPI000B9BD372|nr:MULTISPECIES: NAD(P)H-dependent oxidoreductase [Rhodococcus]OZD68960.1 NADPH-dependent FMN reductase [Rhodococcus sp. 06-1059B-a]OZE81358.1 NADPH-dependent FMN reductase [Rhodococcus fascians]OZF10182.1 NADPH-dependent FMN reductase [Rhodococcus fascians]OZF13273.1 NADPH-dependent FMN reductase [Rhodococcus fascians]OZF59370.1 NADPH-dependent FMN reductase [Rhodococcus fascians]
MTTAVVVGNPKPASRTLAAACFLAERIGGEPPSTVVDVVTLGSALLRWGDPEVERAVSEVSHAKVVVVASPTFKATYTGVLKLFLDQFATDDGLRGVVAIPLMLGAGSKHALAPEMSLRPVLSELGASCPAAGLYLSQDDASWEAAVGEWLTRWSQHLPSR